MGIPSYFSYVLKHHKIMKQLKDVKCKALFLDANSIIYDVIYDTNTILENISIYQSVYEKIKYIHCFRVVPSSCPKVKNCNYEIV